jgi:hypothetical protein
VRWVSPLPPVWLVDSFSLALGVARHNLLHHGTAA